MHFCYSILVTFLMPNGYRWVCFPICCLKKKSVVVRGALEMLLFQSGLRASCLGGCFSKSLGVGIREGQGMFLDYFVFAFVSVFTSQSFTLCVAMDSHFYFYILHPSLCCDAA